MRCMPQPYPRLGCPRARIRPVGDTPFGACSNPSLSSSDEDARKGFRGELHGEGFDEHSGDLVSKGYGDLSVDSLTEASFKIGLSERTASSNRLGSSDPSMLDDGGHLRGYSNASDKPQRGRAMPKKQLFGVWMGIREAHILWWKQSIVPKECLRAPSHVRWVRASR